MSEDRRSVSGGSGFEDLEVFRRAYRVSLEVHRASLAFPAIEQGALGDQVRRASKSIAANLAEGFARQGRAPADFRRFITIYHDGDRVERRDAGMGPLLSRSGLHR